MGYIKLTLERDHEARPYIFFHADYLNEAWLAELENDEKTHIIKQFKCHSLEDCFYELAAYLVKLGDVRKMEAVEIPEDKLKMLREAISNAYPEPPFPGNMTFALPRTFYRNVGKVISLFPTLSLAG